MLHVVALCSTLKHNLGSSDSVGSEGLKTCCVKHRVKLNFTGFGLLDLLKIFIPEIFLLALRVLCTMIAY